MSAKNLAALVNQTKQIVRQFLASSPPTAQEYINSLFLSIHYSSDNLAEALGIKEADKEGKEFNHEYISSNPQASKSQAWIEFWRTFDEINPSGESIFWRGNVEEVKESYFDRDSDMWVVSCRFSWRENG